MRVENTIAMNDYMTGTLRSIIRTINMMISNMRILDQQARVLGDNAFDEMNREITSAEVNLRRLRQLLRDTDLAQQRAGNGASTWAMKLTGVFSAVQLIRMALQAIGRLMTFTDGYTNANARIGLTNDGLRTQAELQDRVLQASRATRASYKATADLVAKIGMTGAMKSTEESVKLAEKVNKLLIIGGGGAQQNEAALLQFSQALSSGRLQGDEFRSLRENAPALMNTIAQGMQVPIGTLKQMSTDGKLTTDVIIKALENMGTTIDEQFAKMPVTFGQNMQAMKDTLGMWTAQMAQDGGLKKLNDMFMRLNLWLASDNGQAFLDGLAAGFYAVATAIEMVVNGIVILGGWFESLGPVADAVLYGIIAVGAMNAAQGLLLMGKAVYTAVAAFLTGLGPIGWIILGIGVAIGAVTAALMRFGFTAENLLTIVGSLLGGIVAFVLNRIIFLYNLFGTFAEFLNNVLVDPVYAIKKLFYDLVEDVLGFVGGLVNGIISGVNGLSKMIKKAGGKGFDTIDPWVPKNPLKKPKKPENENLFEFEKLDYLDYDDMAKKGAGLLTGFLNKAQKEEETSTPGMAGMPSNIDTIGKVDKIGSIDKDVNIAQEDLKYLLDSTTQKYVNQVNLTVQTAAPVINNQNTIKETADAGSLADTIANKIIEKSVIAEINS